MSATPEPSLQPELLLLPEFHETAQPSAVKRRYLDVWLAPLLPILDRPNVTDIYINRPGECWVEVLGGLIPCAGL